MVDISPYRAAQREEVLELSMRAWAEVMPAMRDAVREFAYAAFYPDGWEARQHDDLAAVLDGEPGHVDVATLGGQVVGWVCTRLHPADRMGEVYVLAVDPQRQREGIGTALVEHSCARSRAAGMAMVMVETGGDPGHAPARAAYEGAGFMRWPVARYFRPLDDGATP